jgi:hypothetical protein
MGLSVETVEGLAIRLAQLEESVDQLKLQVSGQQSADSTSPPHPDAAQRPTVQPAAVQLPSEVWSAIAAYLKRIADKLDPPEGTIVGSPYIANRLGQTTTWVAEMARNGTIPKNCIVTGTGKGKPWKFHRVLIDRWLEGR